MAPADSKPAEKLPTKQIVFVNTTSASGPFDEGLSAPGRTIVTATRNGAEQFATLFGGYFVDALTSEKADSDKNKRISVLEAFQYAKTETARAYEREGFLSTEHALLDDDGDKEGTQDPSATAKDGKVAAVVSLGGGEEWLPSDPIARALHLGGGGTGARVESAADEGQNAARYAVRSSRSWRRRLRKTLEIRRWKCLK